MNGGAQAACQGKRAYHEAAAQGVAHRMGLSAYRCRHCGRWHVGNRLRRSHSINEKLSAHFGLADVRKILDE